MKLFTNGSGIHYNALPRGIKIGRLPRLLISFFLSSLLLISGKAFSQSADIDQGENGSATTPKTIFWQNGSLGPSGAHYAEGYSIPYRAKISSLKGGVSAPHTLIIEWDTKDQNGHALDYITYYDNLDNPVGSHTGYYNHPKETVNPTTGTTFSGSPVLFPIPAPSSVGAEVANMPGLSFAALPGAARTNNPDATKIAIWGGTIDSLVYVYQDNQDATTASTKTQLKISFKSNNGTTALIAWGGHIAAEYDWGVGRGASKVSGAPYHMRLISIDGKPGNQDRGLKATAVFVPTAECSMSAALTACEGSSGPLVFSFTGSQTGVTNYAWTLTPSTTNAVISGGNTTTTKSGASVTSISIIPSSGNTFATGTFTVSLTLSNAGGNSQPCTQTGTINQAVTTGAGDDATVCATSPAVTLAGSISGGITTGTWSGGTTASFNPSRTALNAVYTPTAAEIAAGSVTLTLTSDDPTGPCDATGDAMTITINPAVTTGAGDDATVCASSPAVTLAGSISGGITTGTWSGGTTSGFNPSRTALNAVYTPTAAEITAGSVTLTLTSDEPTGPCDATSDAMTITINQAVTTGAGDDATVCASSPAVTLAGSITGGITTGTWSGGTTSGFNPSRTALNAVYTPTAAEITAGSVTLTLTSDEPTGPCDATSDAMTITINPAVTTDAGDDATVCASSPAVTLAGSITGGITTGTWSGGTTSGFNPSRTALNAVYTPTAAEIAAGSVTLTLTSDEPTGPCDATSDQMTINYTGNPSRPAVEYIAPDCNQTTFAVKIAAPVSGGKYTLTQVDGVGEVEKNVPIDLEEDGSILFSGLTIGKGFSIVLKVGDCTSDATDCENYKDEIITAKKPVLQQAAKEVAVSGTKVTAAPNPFNDKIRFSFTPKVSGRASLDLYNLLGEKVKTVFTGQVQKGQTQTIEYNVPYSQRTTLIYMFRVGNEKVSGKLIGLR